VDGGCGQLRARVVEASTLQIGRFRPILAP